MATGSQVGSVRRGREDLSPRLVSSATALIVHALVLIAVTGAIQVERPEVLPPVGVQLIGSIEPMTATAIEIAIPDSELVLQVPAAATIELPELPPPPIEPIAADAFEPGLAADWANADEFARLQGVYLGQIQGRIHRALQTLTDSIAFPSPCNAKVVQDERGRVLDVDLAECAMSDPQRALVQEAIRRASPLPRPPHGLAMGSYLTLNLSKLSTP